MAGRPTHACDGVEFTAPEDPRRGQPSGCPATVQERKAAAKAGHGPKPDQRIEFRLADAPELGKFRLMTGSWDFMKSLESLWRELEAVGGPALCSLGLELVEFTTKSGVDVAYRKPVLKVLAPPRTRSRPSRRRPRSPRHPPRTDHARPGRRAGPPPGRARPFQDTTEERHMAKRGHIHDFTGQRSAKGKPWCTRPAGAMACRWWRPPSCGPTPRTTTAASFPC
ncbi:hypothetical protein [Streptomyces sp. cg2]|uniref:hypothetical protein n=1 Tax=Streptomyces sp. cg2 TaxID=3238799 RepID=UPI0034E29272